MLRIRKALVGFVGFASLSGSFAVAQIASEAQVQSAGTELNEIIVTAQRRPEKLQEVPISVSAFDPEALSSANITSALQLYRLDSSVIMQDGYGIVTPFLRGIGSPILSAGNESSVAVYVDGVYFSRISPILLRLNNIDQVEVLEGPQGTLFGRNASAGLVNIITSDPKPGQDASLRGSVGYGNYRTVDSSAVLDVPLGPNAAFNVSAVIHDQNEGWGYNSTRQEQAFTDRSSAVRAKLALNIGESTHVLISANDATDDSDQGIGAVTRGAPPSGLPDGSGYLTTPSIYDRVDNSYNNTTTTSYGGSIRVAQDLPIGTLINTAATQHTPGSGGQDIDLSPQNYNYTELQRFFATDVSDELRLVSNDTGRFTWTTGLYYFQTHQGFNPQALSGSLYGPGHVDLSIFGSMTAKSDAAFAQGTLKLGAATNLTVGIRDTHDKVTGGGLLESCPVGLGGPCTVIPGTPGSSSDSYTKPTWKVALDHHFTEDLMAYVSDSRGYKAGTFNTLPFSSSFIQPEVLDAYETGVKSEWFDHRLRINGALFYYNYKDPQIITVPVINVTEVQNAGAAKDKGADFSVEVLPVENLVVHIGATYLDAYYSEFNNAPVFLPNPNPPYGLSAPYSANVDGNALIRAPKWVITSGFQYTIPMPDGKISLGANNYYNSGFYWDADNLLKQHSYNLVDANISYAFSKKPITVRLWGSNLFNQWYYSTVTETATSGGYLGIPAAPRTYGLAVDFRL